MPAFAETASITPSQPTHYFYTPTSYVNPPYHLVISLHEISFALPGNLQLQASLFDNIGRINAGVKWGIDRKLSIGAGLAHSIVHIGKGTHGIPSWSAPRAGAFLCWGPVLNQNFEMSLTPHIQFGERFSVGGDIGMLIKPQPIWSVIAEIGSSVDTRDNLLYLNIDGGLRIHPPSIPFLNFDIGIDIEEFAVRNESRPSVTIFFDVIFSMVTH